MRVRVLLNTWHLANKWERWSSVLKRIKKAKARAIAEALFEHTWSMPLRSYLDAETVRGFLTDATENVAVSNDLTTYLRNTMARQESAAIWSLKGSDCLHVKTQDEIEVLLAQNRPLDDDLVEELLKVELVSLVLRRLVERILEAFVDGVLNRDASPLGGVGRSAFGFAARASKGIFDKMSAQIEGPLRQTMATFVQGSMDRLQKQLGDILKSDEVQLKFGEARVTLFKFAMDQPLNRWTSLGLSAEELETLIETVPETVQQIAGNERIRAHFESEIEQFLDAFGDQPIRSVLPTALRQAVEAHLGTYLKETWTEFFNSKAFATLLEEEG